MHGNIFACVDYSFLRSFQTFPTFNDTSVCAVPSEGSLKSRQFWLSLKPRGTLRRLTIVSNASHIFIRNNKLFRDLFVNYVDLICKLSKEY